MNLQSIISQRELPDEPWSDLEKAVLFSALVPYVFKIDPKRKSVSFYLPPETNLEPKEMNGIFESWSQTVDWLESNACDPIGRPIVEKMAGLILEVRFASAHELGFIHEAILDQKRKHGYSFLKHNRGLEILIYDNFGS